LYTKIKLWLSLFIFFKVQKTANCTLPKVIKFHGRVLRTLFLFFKLKRFRFKPPNADRFDKMSI